MQVIFSPSTIKIYRKHLIFFFIFTLFQKKILCNILSHILNQCPINDFFLLVLKIMPVVYVIVVSASQNHIHMSSSGKYFKYCHPTGCPDCPKRLHKEVFQHAESKFAIRVCSMTPTGIQDSLHPKPNRTQNLFWRVGSRHRNTEYL